MQDERKGDQKANEEERDTITVSWCHLAQYLSSKVLGYFNFQHFQHFQQVLNIKVHNKIHHNDEHSTIQQVINKNFNKTLKQKITVQR